MGKKNQYASLALFVPKISEKSKQIALKKLKRLDTKGVPHFMIETKSKLYARKTLAPINRVNVTSLEKETWADSRKIVPNIGEKSLKGVKIAETDMNKNASSPSSVNELDETIFTFRPKVSTASVRIAESLGTDFMSRQQQHLEKQRKLLQEASFGLSLSTSPGQLSPVHHTKKLGRKSQQESGDHNNNTASKPAGQSLDLGGQDDEVNGRSANMCANNTIPLSRTRTHISPNLHRVLCGPYGQANPDIVSRHKHGFMSHQSKLRASLDSDAGNREYTGIEKIQRSKTMPSLGRPKLNRRINIPDGERLRNAKEMAEKAIKYKKVFTIQGGYSTIRQSLRRRGWVEKFYKITPPPKFGLRHKKGKGSDSDDDVDDDDDDDDDTDTDTDGDDHDEPKIPPWEEEDGIYGIMSRMVRNVNPSFIWVLKRDAIDYRFLTKDQIVNHYCKAGSFTTKVGLCINMKNVPWFEPADPDTFFPRCYRLSSEDDKIAFIEDFRLTACINILNIVISQYAVVNQLRENAESAEAKNSAKPEADVAVTTEDEPSSPVKPPTENKLPSPVKPPTENESPSPVKPPTENNSESQETKEITPTEEEPLPPSSTVSLQSKELIVSARVLKKIKKKINISLRVLQQAMQQCTRYLANKDHEDIDKPDELVLSESQWDQLIHSYYQLAHEGGFVPAVPQTLLGQCESLLNRIKSKFPQFEMNGTRNVWIVKPGAKSRGRGIICYNKLEDMLKLVNAQVCQKDGKYVVQKYIERPLLVYNTKFDIRQWFLVTDWSPLTMWFYTDSYVRFCSKQYTLDDFDEAIHLSNNAIQKNKKNGPRSPKLPSDNMWTHEDFKSFLSQRKQGNIWDDVIYPGMKKAVLCSLLVTQDLIEYRKSSFELYGADFMLTEDFHPWLIEINSSPSMEASTAITARLCANVLEDTIKVVIDRKNDKNCDIGKFELAYKQPFVAAPSYIGMNLSLDGQTIRRIGTVKRSETSNGQNSEPYFTPRTNVRQSASLDKMAELKKVMAPTSSASVVATSTKGALPEGGGKVKKSYSLSKVSESPLVLESPYDKPHILFPGQKTSSVEHKKTDISGSSVAGGNSTTISVKHGMLVQPPLQPKPSSQTPSLSVTNSRRIVSRTSVSNTYKIQTPTTDKVKPVVSVNNVESTDLQTIKASGGSKGRVVPLLTTGLWNKTYSHCGSGMDLRLIGTNPSLVTKHLPRYASRFIGRRLHPCFDTQQKAQHNVVYIDTSMKTNPLSIVSRAKHR
ncbi:protein monoglycylase TTLL8-like isoform X2 [Gigantopelta aegis]|uniref:protein monoglycylase TTLL8-like isoform X2 n=1 Tax=Gigantopelta aegis TaxID=1735272 RepID=UPI001B88B38C|nr:protein monoglycylase TTLL8-like isoform X2 [Gigantopelta aegis]